MIENAIAGSLQLLETITFLPVLGSLMGGQISSEIM